MIILHKVHNFFIKLSCRYKCKKSIHISITVKFSLNSVSTRFLLLKFIKYGRTLRHNPYLNGNKSDSDTFNVEEYPADGVIPLHVSRIGNQRVSSIEILKIRGVKMMNLFHPYRITDAGIIVDLHEPIRGQQAVVFRSSSQKRSI